MKIYTYAERCQSDAGEYFVGHALAEDGTALGLFVPEPDSATCKQKLESVPQRDVYRNHAHYDYELVWLGVQTDESEAPEGLRRALTASRERSVEPMVDAWQRRLTQEARPSA
jgi:hypothetical protein